MPRSDLSLTRGGMESFHDTCCHFGARVQILASLYVPPPGNQIRPGRQLTENVPGAEFHQGIFTSSDTCVVCHVHAFFFLCIPEMLSVTILVEFLEILSFHFL